LGTFFCTKGIDAESGNSPHFAAIGGFTMPLFVWKDVIGPGRAFVREVTPEGKFGGVMVVDTDPARVTHWNNSTKAMLKAGLSIPVPLEHGDEHAMDKRTAEAARTLHNSGWVVDSRIGKGGKLEYKLRIDDPETAKAVREKRIGMVSPLIEPEFLDGSGREWNDVIVHLALTNKAVIQPQGEFKRVAASLRTGGVIPKLSTRFRGICCQAVALSAGGGAMGGDKPDDDEVIDDTDEGAGKPPVDPSKGLPKKPDEPGDGGANLPPLNPGVDRPVSPDLIEALKRHNLYLPDDCKLSQLEPMLMVSLNTSALSQGLMDEPEIPGDDEYIEGLDDDDQGMDLDQGQPATDDDEERRKKGQMKEEQLTVPLSTPNGPGQQIVGAPGKSRYAATPPGETQNGKKKVELSIALQRNAFGTWRQQTIDKLDQLRDKGQIPPDEHESLVKAINSPGIKLSIAQATGDVVENAGVRLSIANFSKVPVGTFWSPEERASKYQAHELPRDMTPANQMSTDDAKAIVDQAYGKGDRVN
jgi:hypothetical protein